jgi:hypothetical protein
MAGDLVVHAEDLVWDSKLYPLWYQRVAHARHLYKPGVEQPLRQQTNLTANRIAK